MSDITILKRALISRAKEIAAYLLPNGVSDGREWCVGSINGEAGHSLKVCISGAKAGLWTDFAEGGEGGDLIDLWALSRHIDLPAALDEIRAYLGIEKPKFERPEKIWKRPAKRGVVPASDVLDYLVTERKLSRDAITRYRVAEQGRVIVFPCYLPDGTLPLVKLRWLDPDETGKKRTRPSESDCEPVLFGWPAIDSQARAVTITEGEIDALTAWDYGYPALSVPFGGGKGAKQQWIESEYDRLLRFETIYLALDDDTEGDVAADEIANRLGRHRCVRVKFPLKDLNDCRQRGIDKGVIDACFAKGTSLDPPELRNAGDFSDAVFNLFYPPDGGHSGGYRLPFGKIGERLIFRPSEVTVWTGASGHGKSIILGLACIAWAKQGARICGASLEMAPAQLLRRMVKQAGNVDRPTRPYFDQIMAWLTNWFWIFDKVGKRDVKSILEVFEYARAKYGCDVFFIDSLMRLGIASDDYKGQEQAVFEIVNWAIAKGVHLHLVAHTRKADRSEGGIPGGEDIKGASEIGSNAFNILSIWRDRKGEDDLKQAQEAAASGGTVGAEKLQELQAKPSVVLNVAKQRNGDWEGKVGLWFNQTTYQYRSSADPKDGRSYVEYSETADRGAA